MVVEKAVKMAQMMNIPIVGLVENMSYLQCPDCGKKLYLFGEGKTEEAAQRYGVPLLAKMPGGLAHPRLGIDLEVTFFIRRCRPADGTFLFYSAYHENSTPFHTTERVYFHVFDRFPHCVGGGRHHHAGRGGRLLLPGRGQAGG